MLTPDENFRFSAKEALGHDFIAAHNTDNEFDEVKMIGQNSRVLDMAIWALESLKKWD
jgi:hypothetical protein